MSIPGSGHLPKTPGKVNPILSVRDATEDDMIKFSSLGAFSGPHKYCIAYKKARGGLRCKKFAKSPGGGHQPLCPRKYKLKGNGRVGRTQHCSGYGRRSRKHRRHARCR